MSPGLAPWPLLLDPFRVGAWVVPQVRRCVLFPRACALGCPARHFQGHLHPVSASHPCMINVVTQLFKGKIPVVGSFSLLLSLCECLWKCAKTWDVEQKLPQKNTGGRKRSPFELRARPEGRSSARTPGSSRTGPCPRRSRTYRCKGERLGCGITLGGLP